MHKNFWTYRRLPANSLTEYVPVLAAARTDREQPDCGEARGWGLLRG